MQEIDTWADVLQTHPLAPKARALMARIGTVVGSEDTYWKDGHQLRDVRAALAAVERAAGALTIYETDNPVFAGLPEWFLEFVFNVSEDAKDAARQRP